MINIILLILVMSTFGEFIPVPGIELNQFIILILLPLFYSKTKGRYKYYPRNIIGLIIIFLLGYIIIQGALLNFDFVEFIKTIKNYTISFIFIFMVMNLNEDEYMLILRKYINFCSIYFVIEYFLGYFGLAGLYNMFFNQPYADIRHMANFLSPNSYGIVIAFVMVANLYLFFEQKKKINLIFFILLVLPMLTTVSRSAIIILIVGVTVFAFNKFKITKKLILLLFSCMGIYYILSDKLLIWLYKYYSSYFVRRFILYLESENLFGDRFYEYRVIFSLYKDAWFTGLGFGNITGDNKLYQGMSSMHNEYFRFFIEGGIIGGILFSIIIGFLLYLTLKLYKTEGVDKNTKSIHITFTIMFLIAELQYNFLDAHREGILLIFFGFSIITVFSKTRKLNLSCNNLNNQSIIIQNDNNAAF